MGGAAVRHGLLPGWGGPRRLVLGGANRPWPPRDVRTMGDCHGLLIHIREEEYLGLNPPPTGKVSPKKLVGTIFGERAGVLHSVAGNQPPEVFSERRHPHLSDFHGPVSPWLVASDFFCSSQLPGWGIGIEGRLGQPAHF